MEKLDVRAVIFDLGSTQETLRSVCARSRCSWLVVSFSSDWLFPSDQSRQIVEALIAANRAVTYCNVETSGGHDSFLLEEKLSIYGGLVRAFVAKVEGAGPVSREKSAEVAAPVGAATSIFHRCNTLICQAIHGRHGNTIVSC